MVWRWASFCLAVFFMSGDVARAQREVGPGLPVGEVLRSVDHLQTAGSVLYIAAHPDDENTRLLAYLSGGLGLRTAYLSLTRGDGGQNLIGTEQGTALGVVRTHELLAARRIDGAEQLFTRARDFGYSKSAKETLAVWGHDEILADVVWAIRTFRPDVVMTRFNEDLPNHGHHTASAILAREAFTAAADPARFPDQLAHTSTWQADRLLHNVSLWRVKDTSTLSHLPKLEVGGFDALSGQSWGEISAASRSQHKSQGFGVATSRGPHTEFFVPVATTTTTPKDGPFDGLRWGWDRYQGGLEVAARVRALQASFDPRAPHKSVGPLLYVRQALDDVLRHADPKGPLTAIVPHTRARIDELVVALCGLHLEVRADARAVAPGAALPVELIAINRADVPVRLLRASLPGRQGDWLSEVALTARMEARQRTTLTIDAAHPPTTPHWLLQPPLPGRFTIDELALRTAATTPPPLLFEIQLEIGSHLVAVHRPVEHVWTDRVHGEQKLPVSVVPPLTAVFHDDVRMLVGAGPVEVKLTVTAEVDDARGQLQLEGPRGATVSPTSVPLSFGRRGEARTIVAWVTPTPGAGLHTQPGALWARLKTTAKDGQTSSWALARHSIEHPHLPPLSFLAPAELPLVPLKLARGGVRRVGVIEGPGDKVPAALAAVGYEVVTLTGEEIAAGLNGIDAVVVGVRALNADPTLSAHKDALLAFVAKGGRLLVQYQTNARGPALQVDLWPRPLRIATGRVTDETAVMTPSPASPVVKGPNRLDATDWQGWVQERGLYFAESWDPAWQPVFSVADPGEAPQLGSTLWLQHGKGVVVYSGLSFFRQLPAGVPGAYRLFANLLALSP
jgi:LmbE family N-acetylglucosaminyl deacetylase